MKNNLDENLKNSLKFDEQNVLSDDETIFNESFRSSIIIDENNNIINRNEDNIKKKCTFTKILKTKTNNNHHKFENSKMNRNITPNKYQLTNSHSKKNVNHLDLKEIIQKYNNNEKEEIIFNIPINNLSLNQKMNQANNKKTEEIKR